MNQRSTEQAKEGAFGPAAARAKPRSLSYMAWRRFRKRRLALLGGAALLPLLLMMLLAPKLAPYDPTAIDMERFEAPPSREHPLGTDVVGRDVLSRLIFGARVSLSVGLVAVSINTLVGSVLGAVAGFYGGTIDSTIMRLADMTLSFPMLPLVIVIVAVVGPSIYNIMVVIGLVGWPSICRIVRGQFLSLRTEEFVTGARMIGARNQRIIFRHILPNCLAPVIVSATFGVAAAILMEGALSFLGLGVQPPTASWGNMLTDAQSITILESMPWLWVPPGTMIVLAVLAINFLGDGLRDALDPRSTRD
jgi:peptide/nickel transport system permease protein